MKLKIGGEKMSASELIDDYLRDCIREYGSLKKAEEAGALGITGVINVIKRAVGDYTDSGYSFFSKVTVEKKEKKE